MVATSSSVSMDIIYVKLGNFIRVCLLQLYVERWWHAAVYRHLLRAGSKEAGSSEKIRKPRLSTPFSMRMVAVSQRKIHRLTQLTAGCSAVFFMSGFAEQYFNGNSRTTKNLNMYRREERFDALHRLETFDYQPSYWQAAC